MFSHVVKRRHSQKAKIRKKMTISKCNDLGKNHRDQMAFYIFFFFAFCSFFPLLFNDSMENILRGQLQLMLGKPSTGLDTTVLG